MSETDTDRAALRALLDALPGAVGEPYLAPRGVSPLAILYKLRGKLFAILSAREEGWLVVRSDPVLIDLLKADYAGIGHRTHLDRRYWISIDLAADVPTGEVHRLSRDSYDRIRAALPARQRAELDALGD